MEIYFIVIICLFFNLLILFNFDKITKFLKFFDNPDGKLKKHKNPISLLGGLIILLNFYLVIFTFKALNFDDLIFNGQFFYIVVVLNTLFYIIGVADDINNLSPKIKLLFITLSFIKSILVSFIECNIFIGPSFFHQLEENLSK